MKIKKQHAAALVSILLVLSCILCVYTVVQTASNRRVSVLGYSFFYVLTGSMEPTIPTYAEIVTREVSPEKLEVGDVITFASRDAAISGYTNTHRIVGIVQDPVTGKRQFVTKGDANLTADPETVEEQDVYGKVVFHTGSIVALVYLFRFLGTGYGFFSLIVLPMFAVVVILMRDFTREYKRLAQEEQKERKAREAARIQELKEEMKAEMERAENQVHEKSPQNTQDTKERIEPAAKR